MPPKKSLRRAPPAAAPATEPEVLNQDSVGVSPPIDEAEANRRIDAARAKTLGDHVAEAKDRAQKIPWKHDIGSSVLLLSHEGKPTQKAIIRNIHDHGAYELYDLNLSSGGTIDGLPAHQIGRDLDAEGELAQLRDHLALLQRHNDRAKELAQKHVEMEAEDRRLADVHADHRKRMREVAAQLAQHVRSDPGQTDLRDVVGEGEAEYPEADYMAAGSYIEARVAAGDVVELKDLAFNFDDLRASRLERATFSTGKPQKVKPVRIGDDDLVLTDVQNGVAVLLPLVDKATWAGRYEEDYGPAGRMPIDGESLAGCPVKVGRATLYLAPGAAAFLVRLPADLVAAGDAEPAPSGKDAAAGA